MDEQRDLAIRTRRVRVAHDEPAEQAAVHICLDIVRMVMKSPRAYHLGQHIEYIRPDLSGKDLVTSSTLAIGQAERPRTIRVDAVPHAVNVEAVAVVWITVQHVNVKPFAGARVQY